VKEYRQEDFSGGMNLFDHEAVLPANQYGLAYNVRNRNVGLSGVRAAVEDATIASGKKQGIYAFEQYIISFTNGSAYYKNILTSSAWTKIEGFIMNPNADYVYAEAVPASDKNFERKLNAATTIEGTSSNPSVSTTLLQVSGTPACLICGDGLSTERIIYIDSNGVVQTRAAQTYEEWSKAIGGMREYVPKMKQRKYVNGILVGVAPDGKTLLRSVSGRPLDFVVNVDVSGNKGGDAFTTAYKPVYEEITCLEVLNNQKLIVGTKRRCFPIGFNFDRTIFAEPTFTNNESFGAGIVNQFSFLGILRQDGYADYLFIDYDGMRSLNANLQDQNEGRNSNFSKYIANALTSQQVADEAAAIAFDNYALFSIKTRYGNVVAVFDNIRQQWVGFDNDGIGAIKQFAVANQSTAPILYAITDTKLYKLQAGDYLTSQVNLKASNSGSAKSQLRLQDFYAILDGSATNTTITVTEIVNGQTGVNQKVRTTDKQVDVLRFNFAGRSGYGWKVSPRVEWSDGSNILLVEGSFNEDTNATPIGQRATRTSL
jgi:hypothetical protein